MTSLVWLRNPIPATWRRGSFVKLCSRKTWSTRFIMADCKHEKWSEKKRCGFLDPSKGNYYQHCLSCGRMRFGVDKKIVREKLEERKRERM